MELFGKVAPGFMKLRKRSIEKREEKQALAKKLDEATLALERNNELFEQFLSKYNDDNIAKRDDWMHHVDEDCSLVHMLEKIILKMQEHLLKLRIESMRSEIISFASKVVDENCMVTREQYRRIFKLYDDYEKLLAENGMENGEIDTNYRIINESYEHRLVSHSFLEDIRGY